MKPREKEIDHLVEEYFRYDPETGIVYHKINRFNKNISDTIAGTLTNKGYLQLSINHKSFNGHRIIWRLHYGAWPKNQIDHINGNRSDNRICNLRDVSQRINMQNKERTRNGNLPGCSLIKRYGLFQAEIQVNMKRNFLGYFINEIDAHNCYLKACKAIEKRKFKSAKELREYIKNMK